MNTTKSVFVRNVALAACLAISGIANVARAQDEQQDAAALAPPVQTNPAPAGTVNDPAASVFNWKDVPTNQHVKITRAVFDQGGYQLYAGTGETIVVPFTNNNLYVMKFGQTIGGDMFFVNDGTTPTLYMPKTAFLENTAAQGAKWYPFSDNYDYTGPVYEGIAPTWDAYQGMGWYPGMVCYGGYWGLQPYGFGIGYECMPGFCFSIFGEPYFGWGGYFGYYHDHPYNRFGWGHEFGHYGGGFHGGGFGGGAFHGGGINHGSGFSGRTPGLSSSAFRGASGASVAHRAFSAQPGGGATHAFGGATNRTAFGGMTSRPFGGGSAGGATFSRSRFSSGSGSRTFSSGSFGGGHAFSGGSVSGGGSFGGGSHFSGGGSFGGGGGGSHFGGGGGSFGGGGGGAHFGGGGGGHR